MKSLKKLLGSDILRVKIVFINLSNHFKFFKKSFNKTIGCNFTLTLIFNVLEKYIPNY